LTHFRPDDKAEVMARKLRVEYLGAIYDVLNPGDGRERMFQDDVDRRRFLETLVETCARRGWSAGELERRRKADGEKPKLARRLRAETTMTGGWIAERLAMGTLGYLADTLRNDDEFSTYGNLRD